MGISRVELLGRHQVDSGLLKGKIVSNVEIPVQPSGPRFVLAKAYPLPQAEQQFKDLCTREIKVGFKKARRFLPAVYSFISSCYRGDDKFKALLIDLWFVSDNSIKIVIDAPGHWKTSRFGPGKLGEEAQARFDDVALNTYGEAERGGAYRTRHYVVTATLFPTVESCVAFCNTYLGGKSGMEKLAGADAAAIKPQMMAVTVPYSMRPPQKWFSGVIGHMVPKEFTDLLDDDAVKLLFPPGIKDRILGRPTKMMKVSLSEEAKSIMMEEVREYQGVVLSEKAEELMVMHSKVPNHTHVPYTREFAMSVKVKCDLGLQVRTLRHT